MRNLGRNAELDEEHEGKDATAIFNDREKKNVIQNAPEIGRAGASTTEGVKTGNLVDVK